MFSVCGILLILIIIKNSEQLTNGSANKFLYPKFVFEICDLYSIFGSGNFSHESSMRIESIMISIKFG